jgi:hypothetical protein
MSRRSTRTAALVTLVLAGGSFQPDRAGKVQIHCQLPWSVRLFEDLPRGQKVNLYDREEPGPGATPRATLNGKREVFLFPGHGYTLEAVGIGRGRTVRLRFSDDSAQSYLVILATTDRRAPSRFARFTPQAYYFNPTWDRDPWDPDYSVLEFDDKTKGFFYEAFDPEGLALGRLTIRKDSLGIPRFGG